jgi:hypothetical protein
MIERIKRIWHYLNGRKVLIIHDPKKDPYTYHNWELDEKEHIYIVHPPYRRY